MYRNIDIIGTGSYLPEGRPCNEPVAHRLGISRDWIVRRTGIHQRHVAAPEQATSDLAASIPMALDEAFRADKIRRDIGFCSLLSGRP